MCSNQLAESAANPGAQVLERSSIGRQTLPRKLFLGSGSSYRSLRTECAWEHLEKYKDRNTLHRLGRELESQGLRTDMVSRIPSKNAYDTFSIVYINSRMF